MGRQGAGARGEGASGPPRVLWFIKGLGLGGAERMLVDALPHHDRSAFALEVAYLLPRKGFLAGQVQAHGVPVRCLGVGSNAAMWRAVPVLRRVLRREAFALVHAHLPMAGVVARLAARGTGVRVLYTEHNLQERYHPAMRLANRITFGMNAGVIAVSEDVRRSLARQGLESRAPVSVIPNAVPVPRVSEEGGRGAQIRRELGIAPDAVVVGAVAVFRRQKRLLDWLAVAGRVCGELPGVTFLLAGDGPIMPQVRAEAARLGLGGRLILPGFRPDGRAVLGAVDVFLMTSEFEGLPIALLEAMALGKPVVATAVGGIPEAVTESREGFLLPVGEVGALAERLARLARDGDLRCRMGAAAAETARARFDLAANVRRIEEIYAGLAGDARGN